jgi:hypothetical protein
MSPLDSLVSSLQSMGFAQLGCAFVATLTYACALNPSLSSRVRLWSGAGAFVAAVVFSALTPSWMSGVALMGLVIVATAVFVAGAWLLAAIFGLQAAAELEGAVQEAPARIELVEPETSFGAEAASAIGGPLSLPAPSTPS